MDDFNYNLGGIESPKDYRDIKIGNAYPEPIVFPDYYKVDITNLPVWNQKGIGACVGHAIAKRKQRNEEKETGLVFDFSPRFLYAIAKSKDNYPYEGTYPRLVMDILKEYGCCLEYTLPNDTTLKHSEYIDIKNISEKSYKEAKPFCIKSYVAVPPTVNSMKRAIIEGEGIALLMRIDKNWWTDENGNICWEADKLMPLRAPKIVTSGHEVFVYGWETVNGRTLFYLLNSFGEYWGKKGTGWFYFDEWKPYLVEGWTSVDLPNNWLEEVHNLPKPNTFKFYFSKPIVFGEKSNDVRQLQIALKINGTFPVYISEENYGFYGKITAKAVYDFQVKYHIASLEEIDMLGGRRVGLKTLAKLNEIYNK